MGRSRKEIKEKSKTHSYSCYDKDYGKIKEMINNAKKKSVIKKGEKIKKWLKLKILQKAFSTLTEKL